MKIYESLCDLLKKFNDKNWLIFYLNWEINLINNLGFGFNFDPKNYSNADKRKLINIKLDNVYYKIPSFLIFKNFEYADAQDIYNGLNFSRSLMENKFFIPNNIPFPYSRKLLEKNFII